MLGLSDQAGRAPRSSGPSSSLGCDLPRASPLHVIRMWLPQDPPCVDERQTFLCLILASVLLRVFPFMHFFFFYPFELIVDMSRNPVHQPVSLGHPVTCLWHL